MSDLKIMSCAWILLMSYCTKPGVVNNVIRAPGSVTLTTDKACYKPGDVITFSLGTALPATARVRYRHLDDSVFSAPVTGTTWTWTAPSTDHTGYMVDVYSGGTIFGCIAVDVSSDWSAFPRYGFLSYYSPGINTDSLVGALSRYHINGLQFYDWEYEHHQPLAGTVANPEPTWTDIGNRLDAESTVQGFIAAAHRRNMMAMSYNLAYGALDDAASDGVLDQWYMYTDPNHTNKDNLPLAKPMFKSYIYLMDPSNTGWQQYIASRTADAYTVYPFDGYHVDQVGNLNHTDYTYTGQTISVDQTFGPFLNAMKAASPAKRLVMNAVSQYGQQVSIAGSPVDFLYTEVWPPTEAFSDLPVILQNNSTWSGNTKQTVLAAYMDYNNSNTPGFFNTPGVLLADAVIFAFGGDHLELGDHMLANEYFPNSNLQMKPDLQAAMVHYYDFLTAYENLLRGGGAFNNATLTASGFTVNAWPPVSGSVVAVCKSVGNSEVVHLINLSGASTLDWRDTYGNQTVPPVYQNSTITFSTTGPVKRVWFASPEVNGGTPQTLPFSQAGNTITFSLPSLQYWDMMVFDYQ